MKLTFQMIIGVVIAGIGVGFLAWSVLNIASSLLSKAWPSVYGVITHSELVESRFTDSSYRADIVYDYTVDGVSHAAKRVCYGDRCVTWLGPAKRIVGEYYVGRQVRVRYNPNDPAEAVLEPGLNFYIALGLATAAFLIGFGAMIL